MNADWHPDPTGRHELRYWDGSQWTEHVVDGGVQSTSPMDAGGAPAQAQPAQAQAQPAAGAAVAGPAVTAAASSGSQQGFTRRRVRPASAAT